MTLETRGEVEVEIEIEIEIAETTIATEETLTSEEMMIEIEEGVENFEKKLVGYGILMSVGNDKIF